MLELWKLSAQLLISGFISDADGPPHLRLDSSV